MTRDEFCSLLPHGSAVSYTTPGKVSIAFKGLMPGRSFWLSAPTRVTEERVVLPVVTTISSRSLPPSAAGASSAKTGRHRVVSARTETVVVARGADFGFINSPLGGGSLGKVRHVALRLLREPYRAEARPF